jgi:hypothetical protein
MHHAMYPTCVSLKPNTMHRSSQSQNANHTAHAFPAHTYRVQLIHLCNQYYTPTALHSVTKCRFIAAQQCVVTPHTHSTMHLHALLRCSTLISLNRQNVVCPMYIVCTCSPFVQGVALEESPLVVAQSQNVVRKVLRM